MVKLTFFYISDYSLKVCSVFLPTLAKYNDIINICGSISCVGELAMYLLIIGKWRPKGILVNWNKPMGVAKAV